MKPGTQSPPPWPILCFYPAIPLSPYRPNKCALDPTWSALPLSYGFAAFFLFKFGIILLIRDEFHNISNIAVEYFTDPNQNIQ